MFATMPELAPDTLPLPLLPPNRCGLVCAVDAGDEDAARLGEMGVCVGRTVQLVRGGDPLILRVFGSRVGISARLASGVHVRPCMDDACQAPHPAPVEQ